MKGSDYGDSLKWILGLGSSGFTDPRSIEAGHGGPMGQLYHLEDDPCEQNKLWTERAEIVE